MRRERRSFLAGDAGSSTVEFVAVFVAVITVMFLIVEVTLYFFFMASLEKAAQAGVRAAVVSPPVAGYAAPLANGENAGSSCTDDFPCSFLTVKCEGNTSGDCINPTTFTRIVNHMRGYNGRIAAANVVVTYQSVGIGFAGGPPVPMVTVTVKNVPFQTGVLRSVGINLPLPARSASMTGEDLAQ